MSGHWGIRNVVCAIALCATCFFAVTASRAEEPFPKAEPINYLIAFSAGGISDIFARAQQPLLEKELGQKVIISYKVGAGGAVAWSELVRSKPNGYYTAGFNIPHIILQPLERKDAGYTTSQIKPVMLFMDTPCVLAVRADSPYRTLEDLVRAQKEKPGSIIIGGCGNATSGHIASVMLNKLTQARFTYIPFPGTADLPPALLGNHVTAIMAFTTEAAQYSKDMRVLAVASMERDPKIDAPTFRELGYDIVEGSIRGLAVPPETPQERIDVLYKACAAVNADPGFAKKVTEMGFTLMNLDPRASQEFIDKKVEAYKAILKELKK